LSRALNFKTLTESKLTLKEIKFKEAENERNKQNSNNKSNQIEVILFSNSL